VDQVLEESTGFVVQKERGKALKVLAEALERKDLSKSDQEKLKAAQKRVEEIFFTDRGQSLYESAKNLYLISSPLAAKKMAESLALEGDNVLILKGLVLAELKDGQCDSAKENFQKWRSVQSSPFDAFDALFWYCKGSAPAEFSDENLSLWMKSFFDGVFALWRDKKEAAENAFLKAAELNPDFPEISYWLWKVNPQRLDAGLKYKHACETQKMKWVKKFEEFPWICQYQNEVSGLEDVDE